MYFNLCDLYHDITVKFWTWNQFYSFSFFFNKNESCFAKLTILYNKFNYFERQPCVIAVALYLWTYRKMDIEKGEKGAPSDLSEKLLSTWVLKRERKWKIE